MMSMDQNLSDSMQRAFTRHPEIRLVMLFGSLAAGRVRRDSDFDLAVDAGRALMAAEKACLIAELAEATGRPVDLIDLHVAVEPLLGQILKRGRRILGSNGACAELIKRHVFEEADFMPYRRRILAERRCAWIGK